MALLADVARAGLLLHESTALHRPEPGRKLEGDPAPLVLAEADVVDQHFLHRQHGCCLGHVLARQREVEDLGAGTVVVPLARRGEVLCAHNRHEKAPGGGTG